MLGVKKQPPLPSSCVCQKVVASFHATRLTIADEELLKLDINQRPDEVRFLTLLGFAICIRSHVSVVAI